jgi:hypothetical protein
MGRDRLLGREEYCEVLAVGCWYRIGGCFVVVSEVVCCHNYCGCDVLHLANSCVLVQSSVECLVHEHTWFSCLAAVVGPEYMQG